MATASCSNALRTKVTELINSADNIHVTSQTLLEFEEHPAERKTDGSVKIHHKIDIGGFVRISSGMAAEQAHLDHAVLWSHLGHRILYVDAS